MWINEYRSTRPNEKAWSACSPWTQAQETNRDSSIKARGLTKLVAQLLPPWPMLDIKVPINIFVISAWYSTVKDTSAADDFRLKPLIKSI
jgi:hypothetical protein